MNAQSFLEKIENEADFEQLESTPLSNKYSNVTSVKIVYDIAKDKIYFTNSKQYTYHNSFCNEVLDNIQGLSHFNLYNYSENDNRKYILANINHYRDNNRYTFEFSPYEILSKSNIDLYEKIKNLVFFKENFALFLGSSAHIQSLQMIDSLYPYLNADDIYKDLKYQALNTTKSYGYLKKVDIKDLKNTYISPYDIILINGTPNEVPSLPRNHHDRLSTSTQSHKHIELQQRHTYYGAKVSLG